MSVRVFRIYMLLNYQNDYSLKLRDTKSVETESFKVILMLSIYPVLLKIALGMFMYDIIQRKSYPCYLINVYFNNTYQRYIDTYLNQYHIICSFFCIL